jgi:hypothetical protein
VDDPHDVDALGLRIVAQIRRRREHDDRRRGPRGPCRCICHHMSVVHLLKPGDLFAFDVETYRDGDVLYVEVLEVVRHIPRAIDHVGRGEWGYRVQVRCAADPAQGTPEGVEDFYAWDAVDAGCIRLSPEQMGRAREAGWPTERASLCALLAIA